MATTLHLLALGFVIGSNNLAAALALGALGQASRRTRIVAVFAMFEFLIPLVGVGVGRASARWIQANAGWAGAAALIALGAWTVAAGLRGQEDDERLAQRATTWPGLVVLAAGLSVDNLVIGFSLGLGPLSPLAIASTIAAFSAAFTWAGLGLGHASRRHWEHRVTIGTGALLVLLGIANALGYP